MPGEFFDIRDNYSFSFGGSRPAYPAAKRNVEAAKASLIWTDSKKLSGNDDSIETSPKVAEPVVHESRDRGHCCDIIIDPVEDGIDVLSQLGIGASFRNVSQIRNCLGHAGYRAAASSGWNTSDWGVALSISSRVSS